MRGVREMGDLAGGGKGMGFVGGWDVGGGVEVKRAEGEEVGGREGGGID